MYKYKCSNPDCDSTKFCATQDYEGSGCKTILLDDEGLFEDVIDTFDETRDDVGDYYDIRCNSCGNDAIEYDEEEEKPQKTWKERINEG